MKWLEQLRERKAERDADARAAYADLLKKAVTKGELSEAQTKQMAELVRQLDLTDEQIQEAAAIIEQHAALASMIAQLTPAEQEARELEAQQAALNAEARAWEEQQRPRWRVIADAQERVKSQLTHLSGLRSTMRHLENNHPDLFPAA